MLKVVQNLGQVKHLPMSLLKVIPNSPGFSCSVSLDSNRCVPLHLSSFCMWVAIVRILVSFCMVIKRMLLRSSAVMMKGQQNLSTVRVPLGNPFIKLRVC